MTARNFPYPNRCPEPLGALRLELAPTFGAAGLGGQWQPYTRDLTREVPHLVNDFPRGRGRIDRLVYAPCDWDVATQEVFTSHGRMKVGTLPADHAGGTVLARLTDTQIITLRVHWPMPRVVIA